MYKNEFIQVKSNMASTFCISWAVFFHDSELLVVGAPQRFLSFSKAPTRIYFNGATTFLFAISGITYAAYEN